MGGGRRGCGGMHTMTGEMRHGNNNFGKEECLSVRHRKNRSDVVHLTKNEQGTKDECPSKGGKP